MIKPFCLFETDWNEYYISKGQGWMHAALELTISGLARVWGRRIQNLWYWCQGLSFMISFTLSLIMTRWRIRRGYRAKLGDMIYDMIMMIFSNPSRGCLSPLLPTFSPPQLIYISPTYLHPTDDPSDDLIHCRVIRRLPCSGTVLQACNLPRVQMVSCTNYSLSCPWRQHIPDQSCPIWVRCNLVSLPVPFWLNSLPTPPHTTPTRGHGQPQHSAVPGVRLSSALDLSWRRHTVSYL